MGFYRSDWGHITKGGNHVRLPYQTESNKYYRAYTEDNYVFTWKSFEYHHQNR